MPPQFKKNIQQKRSPMWVRYTLWTLGFLILAGVASVIYRNWNTLRCNWNPSWCEELNPASSTAPIVGADKDEHGCIGSAGYLWCQVKNKCLRTWEEKCEPESVNKITLPSGITDNPTYIAWITAHRLVNKEFIREDTGAIMYDTVLLNRTDAIQECLDKIKFGPGKLINSPDENKSICMGSFGEPDSDVWLINNVTYDQSRIRFCGTPCGFDDGFWISFDQFVLLQSEVDMDNLNQTNYYLEIFDFKNNTKQTWR